MSNKNICATSRYIKEEQAVGDGDDFGRQEQIAMGGGRQIGAVGGEVGERGRGLVPECHLDGTPVACSGGGRAASLLLAVRRPMALDGASSFVVVPSPPSLWRTAPRACRARWIAPAFS